MGNTRLTITLDVPDELVERAEAVGLSLEGRMAPWIDYLQQDIRRREAARELFELSQRASAIPDDEKPTPEEIQEAINWARAEDRKHDADGRP